jgi:hypothetical protein
MTETPYSKREIDEKFDHVGDQIELGFESVSSVQAQAHSAMNTQLTTIENQVKKTNGRVSFLERAMWLAMGAIGVLSLTEVRGIISALFG